MNRWLQTALSRFKLRRCEQVGRGTAVLGKVWIHGGGRVLLGDGVVLDGRSAPIELRALRGGRIDIGDAVRIEGGASIEAIERVELRRGVHLGRFTKLMDNHLHLTRGDRERRPEPVPLVVEEDAWIGHGAVLLPGARVGARARVGPRTVLRGPVPPGGRVPPPLTPAGSGR